MFFIRYIFCQSYFCADTRQRTQLLEGMQCLSIVSPDDFGLELCPVLFVYVTILVSVFVFVYFIILLSCFVCQRSGGFPVF